MDHDEAVQLLAHWGQAHAPDVRAYPMSAASALGRARGRRDLPPGVLDQLTEAWATWVSEECRTAGRHVDADGFCDRCGMSSHLPAR